MTLYASSCERPSKRSARVFLPSSVSNSYSFSTRTHGSSRRFCLISWSRSACSASSFASSSRAPCHSSRVPVLCSGISIPPVGLVNATDETRSDRETHRKLVANEGTERAKGAVFRRLSHSTAQSCGASHWPKVNEKLLPPEPMCSTPATFAITPPPGARMLKNSVSLNSYLPLTLLKLPPNQEAPERR